MILVFLVIWFSRPPKRRGLENGTRITLTAGSIVLHATLNVTKAAESFKHQLPLPLMVLGSIDEVDIPKLKDLGSHASIFV